MLRDKSDVLVLGWLCGASRGSFAETIGIASVIHQLGWGVALLVLLASNAILAIVVTGLIRLLVQ